MGYEANPLSPGRCIFVSKSVKVHFRIPESFLDETSTAHSMGMVLMYELLSNIITKIQNTVPDNNDQFLEENLAHEQVFFSYRKRVQNSPPLPTMPCELIFWASQWRVAYD